MAQTLFSKLFWIIAAPIFVVDQITKLWIQELGDFGLVWPILPGFNIVHIPNFGVSFGLFSNAPSVMPPIILALTILIVIWLLYSASKTSITLEKISYAMVIAGALGNISDRIRLGYVVDFLDLYVGNHHWPAFNVADCAIVMGVVLLLISQLWQGEKTS
jgi:signal peptidase II